MPFDSGSLDLARVLRAGIGVVLAVTHVPSHATLLAGGPSPTSAAESRMVAETCLAQAIGYEAGGEPEAGQEAVAQVVLNRLHAAGFPKTVCGVVFQGSGRRTGCQFTFTCDGSMARRRPADMANALRIARLALDGQLASPVGGATHYHAYYVSPPWAGQLTRVGRIGAHIFYGGAGGIGVVSMARSTAHGTTTPQATVFSAWGLQTAVLTPVAGSVRVESVARPEPAADAFTPPRAPETAGRPSR